MRLKKKPITHEDLLQDFLTDPAFAAAWAIEEPKAFLAANVLRLREGRSLTQADLARLAGMRQPRIAEIERGDANPQLDTVSKIAYALGASTAELLANPERTSHSEAGRSERVLRVQIERTERLSDSEPWKFLAGDAATDNFALAG